MPFGQVGYHFVYIPRRSLCDSCEIQSTCVHATEPVKCASFSPRTLMFVSCRECGETFEIHSSYKGDFLDLCPGCNDKRKERRLAT
jgi:hypothetical protein